MHEAVIQRIDIAAAHDGEAELLVTLAYPNGGAAQITLDEFAARTLIETCQAQTPDALIGASWLHVRDALIASSERFAGLPAENS
ncbi:hypothetical protein [Hyphomonas sp.]|uniref:hypothetical protein n=1 Tax=Hyphomonas sp. TaxID=87 RepID=UPI003918EA85